MSHMVVAQCIIVTASVCGFGDLRIEDWGQGLSKREKAKVEICLKTHLPSLICTWADTKMPMDQHHLPPNANKIERKKASSSGLSGELETHTALSLYVTILSVLKQNWALDVSMLITFYFKCFYLINSICLRRESRKREHFF